MIYRRSVANAQTAFLLCGVLSLAACTARDGRRVNERSTETSARDTPTNSCASIPGSIAPASPATTLFYPHQEIQFASSATPADEGVAIGDVTGDGVNDVVASLTITASPQDQQYVAVLAGNSCGGLSSPINYLIGPASGSRTGLALGDVTNDGLADVVVTTSEGVGVFVQQPDGSLAANPVIYPVALDGSLWERVVVGDFNGDGLGDVALLGWGGQSVYVLYQGPEGTLGAPAAFAVPHGGYDDVATGYLDTTGMLDLVIMSGQTFVSNVSVLLQGVDGSFEAAVGYDVPPTTFSDGSSTKSLTHGVAVGDVTGDGQDDVVTTYGGNSPTSNVAVFAGSSNRLAAPVTYACLDIPTGVAATDVDGDGVEDVVIQHNGWGAIGLLLGGPTGLAPEQLFTAFTNNFDPKGFAVGDINGDGAPDALLVNFGQLNVLFNATPNAAP